MHELVKNYIYGTDQEKSTFLFKVGLYEKIYAPENEKADSVEYPFIDDNQKRYKKVVVPVTDEEFIAIQDTYKTKKQMNEQTSDNTNNNIANVLGIIGIIIFVVGFISGFVSANALITWAITFSVGMLFLGFAEIIILLTAIKNKW